MKVGEFGGVKVGDTVISYDRNNQIDTDLGSGKTVEHIDTCEGYFEAGEAFVKLRGLATRYYFNAIKKK